MSMPTCQNVVEPIAQQFSRQPLSPMLGERIVILRQVPAASFTEDMSVSTCQNVVEPIAQQFTRQPLSPIPSERMVIPQQVSPCPSECIVTRKLVSTRLQSNVKMPLGKTFIVPRGAFGPQRAKEDGGALFEMVQKSRNGYISQKAVKQLMAQVEETVPCTTGRHGMPGLSTGDYQSIANPRLVPHDGQSMASSLLDISSSNTSTTCPTPLGSARIPVRHAGSFLGSADSSILPRPVSIDSSFDALSMLGNSAFTARPASRQSACVSCAGVSTPRELAAGVVSTRRLDRTEMLPYCH